MNPHTDKTSRAQPALGKAIRKLRQERGGTLESLASEAGITLNMLSLIERGEGNPTWATVRGIATALNVPVWRLAKLSENQIP